MLHEELAFASLHVVKYVAVCLQETKRRRTFDNFYTFCSFVLEYEEKLVSSSIFYFSKVYLFLSKASNQRSEVSEQE